MQIIPLYPVPVYVNKIDNFNNIQEDLLNFHSKTTFKPKISGEHGLSDPTFRENFIKNNKLKVFENEIIKHLKLFLKHIKSDRANDDFRITESWMTSTKKEQYAPRHDHGSHDLSGVYYVRTNGNDGSLYFETPVKQLASSYVFRSTHPEISIPPQEGLLILFPGWLEHGVGVNRTDNERISVSFNLNAVRKNIDK